jgi:hypothetical protein
MKLNIGLGKIIGGGGGLLCGYGIADQTYSSR